MYKNFISVIILSIIISIILLISLIINKKKIEKFTGNNTYYSLYNLSDRYSKSIKSYQVKDHDKFIIFNYDQGGFNNIRISFEVTVILAKYLDRVLVIPPKIKYYLLGDKKRTIFDFYSKKNLSNYISICDYSDITSNNINDINHLYQFVKSTNNYYFYVENNDGKNGCLVYKDNQLLSTRNNKTINLKNIQEKYLCLYSIDDNNDINLVKKLIPNYNENNSTPRFLFNYEFYFRMDLDNRKLLYQWVFDSIKLNENIITMTIDIYKKIGLQNYNAVHLRSNDFQQYNALNKLKLSEIALLIKHICSPNEKLLIITDHDNIKQIADYFTGYQLITKTDIYRNTVIMEEYQGLIESLLCVLANNFIGTEMSTFSHYIQILRGYMSKYHSNINTDLIYTTTIHPKIDKYKFNKYQKLDPNDNNTDCHIWSRISNNIWKYL